MLAVVGIVLVGLVALSVHAESRVRRDMRVIMAALDASSDRAWLTEQELSAIAGGTLASCSAVLELWQSGRLERTLDGAGEWLYRAISAR